MEMKQDVSQDEVKEVGEEQQTPDEQEEIRLELESESKKTNWHSRSILITPEEKELLEKLTKLLHHYGFISKESQNEAIRYSIRLAAKMILIYMQYEEEDVDEEGDEYE